MEFIASPWFTVLSLVLQCGVLKFLYEYLKENYGENVPIYISRLKVEGMSENTLRQQVKRLTDAGLLKRYFG